MLPLASWAAAVTAGAGHWPSWAIAPAISNKISGLAAAHARTRSAVSGESGARSNASRSGDVTGGTYRRARPTSSSPRRDRRHDTCSRRARSARTYHRPPAPARREVVSRHRKALPGAVVRAGRQVQAGDIFAASLDLRGPPLGRRGCPPLEEVPAPPLAGPWRIDQPVRHDVSLCTATTGISWTRVIPMGRRGWIGDARNSRASGDVIEA